MTAIISYCTMKPSSRILIGCKNSSSRILAMCHHSTLTNSMSNSNPFGLNLAHSTMHCPFGRVMNGTQKVFGLPSWSFRKEGVSTIAGVAFKARDFSGAVETHVNDNSGEKVYVKGGRNVKPLLVERIDHKDDGGEDESRLEAGGEEDVNKENCSGGLKNVSETKNSGGDGEDETEVEKEAWSLLQNALVTYCDTPVGTVAAATDGNQPPQNYDQVFIRDFIPSALAFLLKGETEIVKNFLLHTLQLQVIIIYLFFFFSFWGAFCEVSVCCLLINGHGYITKYPGSCC